jgi:LmbE family N-acetylglucosaminyl deacetylase
MTEATRARVTTRVSDITGPENLMLFLPEPGGELACAGLIAESCARGRPPFVAVIGDGAPDGSAAVADGRERATRAALAALGLPDGRLLFVGMRQGRVPGPGHGLFPALARAMALLSWRHDCNVIGALATGADADTEATWRLAESVAGRDALPLLAIAPATPAPAGSWTLDVSGWRAAVARARAAHGVTDVAAAWETFARSAPA